MTTGSGGSYGLPSISLTAQDTEQWLQTGLTPSPKRMAQGWSTVVTTLEEMVLEAPKNVG